MAESRPSKRVAAAAAAVTPLLDAIGLRTVVISAYPPAANLVKLSGNFLIAAVMECWARPSVAEYGVDRRHSGRAHPGTPARPSPWTNLSLCAGGLQSAGWCRNASVPPLPRPS
jgi:hypothetical protein